MKISMAATALRTRPTMAAADSGIATVTITVDPVNDAPAGENDSYNVNEDETLNVAGGNGVLSNDSDVEDDSLTAILVSEHIKWQVLP